jgi:regulator of protease activity HflC (stomatin/prohibitin superfamily)
MKYSCIGALLICLLTALMALQLVHQASPNEWLLVVNAEGEQLKATVGGTHIAQPWEKVVKFPATLQKVAFQAQQVTREMQGIEVSGFASWVVFRDQDGPLKAYRHLNGLSPEGIEGANDSLRVMAESILRAKVAHSCAAAPCIDVLGELMVVVVR